MLLDRESFYYRLRYFESRQKNKYWNLYKKPRSPKAMELKTTMLTRVLVL